MKLLLIFTLAGFVVGMWFGINIGKGNALYDNPLSDPGIIEEAHDSADDQGLIDQGKEYLDDKKQQVKEKVKNMVDDL
ncbi:hypothetical protein NBRC116188_09490 [Oceaniserpentilla sp. 4NH20-0058]|uniref:hypothetical protein n=1 Tax=Oceaniserpentilla sp. 4NH20-0058 TaxID=3127660 RepID=UPI0031035400